MFFFWSVIFIMHVHKPVLERSVVVFEIPEALSGTQLWRGVGVRGGDVRRGGGTYDSGGDLFARCVLVQSLHAALKEQVHPAVIRD